MRPPLRFILLLILSIALRGFSGVAFAQPEPANLAATIAAATLADCPEHQQTTPLAAPAHHQPGDKSCQISCDLAAAPALITSQGIPLGPLPDTLRPTLPLLAFGEAPPPDHPPPIR